MDFDFTTESITPNNTLILSLNSTGALSLPVGTTAQRPATPAAGGIRWNTSLTTPAIEFYNGSTWNTFGGSGTVTSVALSGGTTGLTTSGGPVTSSGTITLAGTLAIANGGTGKITAAAAFNAISPVTTLGDIIYASGANTATRLAGNITTTTKVLTQTGNGTISSAPVWATVSSGGSARVVTTIAADTTAGTTAGTTYVYIVDVPGGAAITLTVPTAVGNTSTYIIKIINGTLLFGAQWPETVDGTQGIYANSPYTSITIISDNTNWIII